MSSEMLVRVLIVAGVAVMALAVAFGIPRLAARRSERRPPSITDLPGEVLFFTSRSCPRCDQVRRMLRSEKVEAAEIVYEEHTGDWDRWGVGAVPLLVIRRGSGPTTLAGPISRRRLRRALAGK